MNFGSICVQILERVISLTPSGSEETNENLKLSSFITYFTIPLIFLLLFLFHYDMMRTLPPRMEKIDADLFGIPE